MFFYLIKQRSVCHRRPVRRCCSSCVGAGFVGGCAAAPRVVLILKIGRLCRARMLLTVRELRYVYKQRRAGAP